MLGMDTDTEVYQKFGTMTGPDVLVIGKSWVDADPQRAKKFLAAYFEAIDWIKENTDLAVETVQGKYIQQDIERIRKNMAKFIWHDLASQRQIMSDSGIFGQADYIVQILHEDMKAIPQKPVFRNWVNLDVLPFENE